MLSYHQSSQSDAGGVAPCPLTRAGLRQPPVGAEPTGVFVVIEMAVLSCVSALAMVSIIVSIDEGTPGQGPQQVARVGDQARPAAPVRDFVVPRQDAQVGQSVAQVARVAQ